MSAVPRVVALFGPTASGKSALAVALGRHVGGEIVSADAMQLYRGLPILSNQPSVAERAGVPHHLVGVWGLDEDGDVARYAEAAHAAIDEVLARGRVAIVVGGTGLYLRAALVELELPPAPPPGLRDRLVADYDRDGPVLTHARLAAVDAAAAARIHPNDRRRVVRALELHDLGRSLAPQGADALWSGGTRLPTLRVGLAVPRPELHRRIAARTRQMFDAGVVDEVRRALAATRPSATAARALGLDELAAMAAGTLDRATAERRLVERTRAYARRQEIWMRRIPALLTVDATRPHDALVAHLARLIAPSVPVGRGLAIRAARPEDVPLLRAMLAEAGSPPGVGDAERRAALAHPVTARYIEGWGRPGDVGVVAEADGRPIGAAWYRRFAADAPAYGFVDADTPELSIAVAEPDRGRGVGTALLEALVRVAREVGEPALSLSVGHGNPARRLYERLGFRPVTGDPGGSTTMRLDLRPPHVDDRPEPSVQCP